MNFRMPKIWQILKQFANNRSFLSSTNFSLQKNDVHDMVWYTIHTIKNNIFYTNW